MTDTIRVFHYAASEEDHDNIVISTFEDTRPVVNDSGALILINTQRFSSADTKAIFAYGIWVKVLVDSDNKEK